MSRCVVTMPNFGMLGKYWTVMLWYAVRADAVKGGGASGVAGGVGNRGGLARRG